MPNIQNGSAKGKKKNKEEDSDDNKNRPKRDAARKAEVIYNLTLKKRSINYD